ncbi:glycosyltransferase [Stutzerimonas nitrititolerans]|uniref:glycosyltransferase n=1 Tax=Stutzerimonas nitrititolerans TaxID=2482751 RepID=UPI00289BD404|nr:glycosyltransferase [Stutzerimonas nitrititolerans]
MDKNKSCCVAILLAAYNGVRWLDDQLESIVGQIGVQLDIFVSVDLSTDNTYEYFRELAASNSRVRLLSYGERFGGAAPNFYRLISEVDFEDYDFVAYADQDDIWHFDKLKRACDVLASGEADVYSSNVTAFWSDGREELIDKAQPSRRLDYFFEAAGPGCTYVFQKSVMLELQVFVRSLPEDVKKEVLHDWLSYAFCRERGFRWYIDPTPSVRYRQHASNVVGTNNNWVAYKKRFALIRTKAYRKRAESLVGAIAPQRLADISNRFFLVKNFMQLRRRKRDRYFLLFMLLLVIY